MRVETPEGASFWVRLQRGAQRDEGAGLTVFQGALRKGSILPLATRKGGRACAGVTAAIGGSAQTVLSEIVDERRRVLGTQKDSRTPRVCCMTYRASFVVAIQLLPQALICERIAEDLVGYFVPRIVEEIVARIISQERAQNCTEKQIVNGPVHQLRENMVE